MPLNYKSFDIREGSQDGVLEIHHEHLKVVVGDETTILDLEHIVEIRVVERDPQDDRIWFRTAAGDWRKYLIEDAPACIEAIPASFRLGW